MSTWRPRTALRRCVELRAAHLDLATTTAGRGVGGNNIGATTSILPAFQRSQRGLGAPTRAIIRRMIATIFSATGGWCNALSPGCNSARQQVDIHLDGCCFVLFSSGFFCQIFWTRCPGVTTIQSPAICLSLQLITMFNIYYRSIFRCVNSVDVFFPTFIFSVFFETRVFPATRSGVNAPTSYFDSKAAWSSFFSFPFHYYYFSSTVYKAHTPLSLSFLHSTILSLSLHAFSSGCL